MLIQRAVLVLPLRNRLRAACGAHHHLQGQRHVVRRVLVSRSLRRTHERQCSGRDLDLRVLSRLSRASHAPDFLPITVVYDDPETLAFGIMYASDEAYANPSSVLMLPKVNVARMTRAEYDDIRRTGVRNVVRNPRNDGQFGIKESVVQPGKKPPIGTTCEGWSRLELPSEARAILREHWPSDKPRYWRPEKRDASLALEKALKGLQVNGWTVHNYGMSSGVAGLLRVDGGAGPFLPLWEKSCTLLSTPLGLPTIAGTA